MNYAQELPLFVYGTLRLGSRNHGKIEPVVRSVDPAALPDHALYMDQGPLVRPEAGRVVRGDVVSFCSEAYASTMAGLDAFEGFDPADPGASIYLRERVVVRTDAGDRVEAWCYFRGSRPIEGECLISGFEDGLIEDGDWLRLERAAAQ